ncbi:AI-2E family transporter [candidate division KSB1 bacterium]|nr:AI-2E family transporter [candidate division KSB1 bacterium]
MAPHDSQAKPAPERPAILQEEKTEKLSRYFLLAVLIGIGVVFFNMVKIFLVPVMLAAVFAGIFYPLYQRLLKIFHQRKGVSSFFCCVILLLGLLIPTYFVANLVAKEAIEFYQSTEQIIREIIDQGDKGVLGRIKQYKWVEQLNLEEIEWQSSLKEAVQTATTVLATVINKASTGTFQVITDVFLTLFAMFYFFTDGDRLIRRLKYLSPLAEEYEDELIKRFFAVSRATLKGTLLIGLLKGALGALTFWIFGIRSPILWGVVMVILSVIPMIGAWLVMYPAAIILIIIGQVWQGIAVFLIAAIIIGNIDNVLGPKLVARDAGMHDLLIFFSTLGGISVFGMMGFIIGPIIAALFLTILDVYGIEFRSQLDSARNLAVATEAKAVSPPAEAREMQGSH